MSIWDEKYNTIKKDIENTYYPKENKSSYVNSRLEVYVGTIKDIEIEKERLMAEFKDIEKKERAVYYEKINALIQEYTDELFAEYPCVPTELCAIAYSMAYDRGHSCGYSEVENYFDGYMEHLIKAYNMGKAC